MNSNVAAVHPLVITQAQPDTPIIAALLAAKEITGATYVVVSPEDSDEDIERLLRDSCDEINDFRGVMLYLLPPGLGSAPPEALDLSAWQAGLYEQIRVPFVVCKAILKEFLLNDDPVNLVLVFSAPDNVIEYATRHGLTALIRNISKEYGSLGIHCNGVSYPVTFLDEPSRLDPLIKTVLFLISDGASFINGEVIRLKDDRTPRMAHEKI